VDEEERIMIKKVDPEYIKYNSTTSSSAEYDGSCWKVSLEINIVRTNKEGVESVAKFSVWSIDKSLEKAQATTQLSAASYFNTRKEDELYGEREIKAPDIKNPNP
jgi:hypothetical protein